MNARNSHHIKGIEHWESMTQLRPGDYSVGKKKKMREELNSESKDEPRRDLELNN